MFELWDEIEQDAFWAYLKIIDKITKKDYWLDGDGDLKHEPFPDDYIEMVD